MSESVLAALLSGTIVGAIIGLVQFLISRHDKKKEKKSVERQALCALVLNAIQSTARVHLKDGSATIEEKRQLHQWHDLYHNGLGGNGDADALMKAVDSLPLDVN